jgi:hypothetical protein
MVAAFCSHLWLENGGMQEFSSNGVLHFADLLNKKCRPCKYAGFLPPAAKCSRFCRSVGVPSTSKMQTCRSIGGALREDSMKCFSFLM